MKKIALATLLAWGCAVSNVMAQSSQSSGALSNFSFQLVDLDLTDGITPSITLYQAGVNNTITEVIVFDTASSPAFKQSRTSTLGVTTRTNSQDYGAAYGQASLTAGSGLYSLTGAAATVSGSVTRPVLGPDGHNTDSYTSSANILPTSSFTLSAHTAIIISAQADLSSATSGFFDPVNYSSGSATATVKIGLNGETLGASTIGPGEEKHVSQLLSASFYNYGSGNADNYFNVSIQASGSTVAATPVSEPEAYAMLLAGVGILGFAARRRRKVEA